MTNRRIDAVKKIVSLCAFTALCGFHSIGQIDDVNTSDWYREAKRSIEKSEYNFNENGTGKIDYFNRSNAFSGSISSKSFEFSSQSDDRSELRFILNGNEFDCDAQKLVKEDTLEYDFNQAIKVQYINNAFGLRQNFIVSRKKEALTDNLVVKMDIETSLLPVIKDGGDLIFLDDNKIQRIEYGGLKIWDTNKNLLSGHFELEEDQNQKLTLSIVVDDDNAVYPITIDPLTSTSGWSFESNVANANLGFATSTAGDVNGDGFSDVIVGAPFYENGQVQEGRVYAFYGSVNGLSTIPDWSYEANFPYAILGTSVATAGDVNGDGFSDIVVGAPGTDWLSVNGSGAIYVFHGSATGLSLTPNWSEGEGDDGALFGSSVRCAGDINNDGYSDVIVGSVGYETGIASEGAAFIYYGSAAGLSLAPDWSYTSGQANSGLGISVSSAGDVNGDNYSDVIIGAGLYDGTYVDGGAAFVFYGSATTISLVPDWIEYGTMTNGAFGTAVSFAGDVNGDGYSEVIIGAPLEDSGQLDEGVAYIFHGSPTGLSLLGPNLVMEGDLANAGYGTSLSAAGDVNADGYADIIVGAPTYGSVPGLNEGAVFVYLGSNSGLSGIPALTLGGIQPFERFGSSVCMAGDVNGDGVSDFLTGSPFYSNNESNEGRSLLYLGNPDGLSNSVNWSYSSPMANWLGLSLSSAGDVNGDGYSDVIVGTNSYNGGGAAFIFHGGVNGMPAAPNSILSMAANQSFGNYVSTAGDVNGDGYSDIIIGSPDYSNGELSEGGAWIYYGSPTGVDNTPDWNYEGGLINLDFGLNVTDAGDVNGDGFSDVVVLSRRYTGAEFGGRTFYLFYGSNTGPSNTPDWAYDDTQTNARSGSSMANAGDLNGDGYSDLIFGAYSYDEVVSNDGGAFVFYGSNTGYSAVPDWSSFGTQANGQFGYSVNVAGDVNGDGFSDVIIGERYYSNGETQEGRAHVYLGSGSGLPATANWMYESNYSGARFGSAVSTAGDVNGDGYSDIVIGAENFTNPETYEGAVFSFYGSPTGLGVAFDWMYESNTYGGRIANVVSCAGDVDGDGYDDVLIGTRTFNGNQGNVELFLGNEVSGDHRISYSKLYNSDLVTPLSDNTMGVNLPTYGVGHYGISPIGRTSADLFCEIVNEGQAFSGTPITNSPGASLTSNGVYSDLGILGQEIKVPLTKTGFRNNTRCRLHYNYAKMIDGQPKSRWYYLGDVSMNGIGILPVELLSFEATLENRMVRVDWTTVTETNNDKFIVERSADGQYFDSIATVSGAGTSLNLIEYKIWDEEPLNGISYYRLQQIDFDGSTNFSDVVAIKLDETEGFSVFPNPTNGSFSVVIDNLKLNTSIRVFNVLGAEIYFHSGVGEVTTINLETEDNGLYFVQIENSSRTSVQKIIKR